MKEHRLSCVLFALALVAAQALAAEHRSPKDGWRFKFKDFVIGAWWGPGATEPEMKLYKEAGFNVVMAGRYMQLGDYGHADKGILELDLAHKHGLGVMFDTYTKNDRPWGGKAGPTDRHPSHHPASLTELKWLHGRLGRHPALIGFMIGDDQGAVSKRSHACTRFLHERAPHLMPWLCGWIPPRNLAAHHNPIMNPQIYPTLYQWHLPATELARRYCHAYATISRQCQQLDVTFWPMFNVAANRRSSRTGFADLPTDSLTRLPAYAAVAYGAEGIWYFTYNGGAIQAPGKYKAEAEVRKALTPLYPIARKINRRLAAWGPRVLGRTSTGLFGTAFAADDWPFDDTAATARSPEALAPPAEGKLVETMSDDLIVGILTKQGENPLAMVVDCRVSKKFGEVPPRQASVRFAPAVATIRVLEGAASRQVRGRQVKLSLEAGGGQLLELAGSKLPQLCSPQAIYAPPPRRTRPAASRPVVEKDLAGIRAAKLRIDVFGANAEPQYADRRVVLNGTRIATVPPNARDAWDRKVVELSPAQLRLVRMTNLVTIVGPGTTKDAWKLRNVTLAAQLADGTWVRTNAHQTTYGAKGWAHFEGTPIPANGVIGPMELKFRRAVGKSGSSTKAAPSRCLHVACGARGLVYRLRPKTLAPESAEFLKGFNRKINQMKHLLLIAEPVDWASSSNDQVKVRVLLAGTDGLLLFLLNSGDRKGHPTATGPGDITVRLPPWVQAPRLAPEGDRIDGTVTSNDRQIRVRLS